MDIKSLLTSLLLKIKVNIYYICSFNYLKTLYYNYKIFPFDIAKKMPLQIGWNVDMKNACKGSILLEAGVEPYKHMIKIGITPYPMWSNKGKHTMIRLSPSSKIVFGKKILLETGSSLIASYSGIIHLGSDFRMNQDAFIYASKLVEIGEHCRIGWGTQIYDTNFHFTYDMTHFSISSPMKKVIIGNNVWIGNRSTVNKGAFIPSFSIVASNSLFNKDFSHIQSKGNLFAGQPCKLLKTDYLCRIVNSAIEQKLFNHFLKEESDILYKEDPAALFDN